jgi:Kef-type K+ transport system membrane component KefB
MARNLLFYAATLAVFGAGLFVILSYGAQLPPNEAGPGDTVQMNGATRSQRLEGSRSDVTRILVENLNHPLSKLLIQVIVIVAAARVVGSAFRRIGQPPVIGEMVAGILLGPSLLGWAWPPAMEFLFPESSLGALKLFSQAGVILFMFVVGIDLDVQHLRHKADAAVVVSHASIVVPFFLGTSFALLIFRSLAPAGVSFVSFGLFIGIAMSITAFPVLARIVEERGLSRSHLGSTCIACAAVDDVTAWCLLAVVICVAGAGSLASAGLTVALALAFIAVMLLVVRPRVQRFTGWEARSETGSKGLVAGVLVFAFAAALFTEVIGIHALFGAFLAGVVMPPDARLRRFLRERLETFSSALLLPLFFALTGLRTQVGLLNDGAGWLLCAAVVAVAVAGKLGGSTLAARWTGMAWRDAFAIGVLMNTRGLMELIALNIGYDLGILSPRIFAMMVLMALVTTFMTGPLLAVCQAWSRREGAAEVPAEPSGAACPGPVS